MSLFVDSSQHEGSSQAPSQASTAFSASTTQISHLADVLSAIVPVSSQALVIISPKGITLYSDYNHICNLQVSLDPSLFTSYNFYSQESQQDELRLCLDVKILADCFNAVAPSTKQRKTSKDATVAGETKCFLHYGGEGSLFVVEFEDSTISEQLEFATFYSDILYPYDAWERSYDREDDYGLILNHSEVQFEVILKSDVFFQVLRDLELVNTVDLFLMVSNKVNYLGNGNRRGPKIIENLLQFVSKGFMGHLKLMYPPEKSILEKLNVYELKDGNMMETNGSITASYNYSILKNVQRAVRLSSKCKIRKDLAGTLSIQLLCRSSVNLYSGTLMTFNMMESSSEPNPLTSNNFKDMFDDDYQFADERNEIEEYQDLGKVSKPAVMYDMFRQDKGDEGSNDGVPIFF